jgi:hypothetical protein
MSKSQRPAFADHEGVAEGGIIVRGKSGDAAAAVLAAFEAAEMDELPPVDCYRAGVAAWRRFHPSQTAAHAAKKAVAIILAAKVSLRVDDA